MLLILEMLLQLNEFSLHLFGLNVELTQVVCEDCVSVLDRLMCLHVVPDHETDQSVCELALGRH